MDCTIGVKVMYKVFGKELGPLAVVVATFRIIIYCKLRIHELSELNCE